MLCKRIISAALAATLLFGLSDTSYALRGASVKVPVLLYHHITDKLESPGSQITQSRFERYGILITFTSRFGSNELVQGDKSTLREMCRLNISGDMSSDDLLAFIDRY